MDKLYHLLRLSEDLRRCFRWLAITTKKRADEVVPAFRVCFNRLILFSEEVKSRTRVFLSCKIYLEENVQLNKNSS